MGHAAHPAPATRPALEVAHILREGADAYRQTHRLSAQQQRVVNALVSCRTAALGGFKSHCNHCGAETIQYASCRNRHCPKCQTLAQTRWVERHRPPRHRPLACRVHRLTVSPKGSHLPPADAASKTLLFGRNPRWLGGELGITMVLHTWGQNLGQHIHVHCIVTDGALSPDRERWLTPPRRGFLFPKTALSKVFRASILSPSPPPTAAASCACPAAMASDTRAFGLKTSLQSNDWVVYTKAPFAGVQCSRTWGLTRPIVLVDFDGAGAIPLARLRPRQAQGDAPRSAASFFMCSRADSRGCATTACSPIEDGARNLALCRALLDQPAAEPQ